MRSEAFQRPQYMRALAARSAPRTESAQPYIVTARGVFDASGTANVFFGRAVEEAPTLHFEADDTDWIYDDGAYVGCVLFGPAGAPYTMKAVLHDG